MPGPFAERRTARRLLCWLLAAANGVLVPSRAAAEGNDEDIVETFDDQGTPTQAPVKSPPPKKEEAPQDKIDFRGFARFTTTLGLAPQRAAPGGGDNVENVAYDRGAGQTQGYFDLRYSRGKSFQAVISGSLAYAAYVTEYRPGSDAPARDTDFSFFEPVLREAYIGLYSDRVDFRIGQQRIVWGNSDAFGPNDVLNARDTRDRMQLDTEMIHLPTLAVRGDFDLGVATLGIVAQPFFVPDRFSLYGGNWSLVQPDAPRPYRRLFGLYAKGRDRALVQDVQDVLVHANTPRTFPDGASAGASLRFHTEKVDASFYYEFGHDRAPFVYLDPALSAQLDKIDPNQVNGVVLDAFLKQLQNQSSAYGGPFIVQYLPRQHIGADFATTAGPFVLRSEAAFDSLMAFTTKDTLNSVARPVAQGVVGVEYQTGETNKIVILEANYLRVLGPKIPVVPVADQANYGGLLFFDEDNVTLANVVRWSFFENLVVEMRTLVSPKPFWYLVRPEIGYGSASFTARVGVMVLEGRDFTFGHWYRRNNSVYLTARYAF